MSRQDDLVIINLSTGLLLRETVQTLWSEVVHFCVERGVNSATFELGGGPLSRKDTELYERLEERLLGAANDSGVVEITPEILEAICDAGPVVIAVSLFFDGLWWGGIYDWGSDVAILLERDDWEVLRQYLDDASLLPAWDMEEVVERTSL